MTGPDSDLDGAARRSATDDGEGSAELRRAIAFLGWEATSARVIETGYWAGVGVGLTCAVVVAFVSGPVPGLLSGLAGGLGATHIAHRGPVWLASLRRTRALGAAPGLVGRLVLRMRLDPSTERAVRFAARTGDGPLADGLARHERANTDGPTSGLRAFAREWQPWFPAIDRAAALVRTAASAPPERRGRCLDRALDATISGTTDRLAAFVGEVRSPVSALYAFGVLLPLALIALLPAAAATGVPIGPGVVAALYLGVLPAGCSRRRHGCSPVARSRSRPRVSTKTTRMSRRELTPRSPDWEPEPSPPSLQRGSSPDGPLRSQGSASEPASRCSLPFTAAERCCRTSVPSSAPSQTR